MTDWHFIWTVTEHSKEDVRKAIGYHFGIDWQKVTRNDVLGWFLLAINAEYEALADDYQIADEQKSEEREEWRMIEAEQEVAT